MCRVCVRLSGYAWGFVNGFCLCVYRGGGQGPELCGGLPGAGDAGPSLPEPGGLPEPGAEGVGDGRPSLPRQVQPLEEERQGGSRPKTSASPQKPVKILKI